MTVIAGRTSQGKTMLGLQIAWDLAVQGKSVVYLSLEMTVTSLLERLFCHVEEVDNMKLLTGKFNEYQTQRAKFEAKMENATLLITEGIGKTWMQIERFISLINPKPDCIILDYIGCIEGGKIDRKVVNDYIYRMRASAVINNYALIMLSQINRANMTDNKDKLPTLEGLKETGVLEEHADKAILLHYPHYYNNSLPANKYRMIIAKNRNGRTGSFEVEFNPQYYKFNDLNKPIISASPEVQKVADIFDGRTSDGRP